uniref:Uncharacterized protein n=1 Tax=Mycena chlorophos TaxID=658473 RepID=A0ABQ0L954_MYCCL|nr:predicted protein [Mycena chlorophos]
MVACNADSCGVTKACGWTTRPSCRCANACDSTSPSACTPSAAPAPKLRPARSRPCHTPPPVYSPPPRPSTTSSTSTGCEDLDVDVDLETWRRLWGRRRYTSCELRPAPWKVEEEGLVLSGTPLGADVRPLCDVIPARPSTRDVRLRTGRIAAQAPRQRLRSRLCEERQAGIPTDPGWRCRACLLSYEKLSKKGRVDEEGIRVSVCSLYAGT